MKEEIKPRDLREFRVAALTFNARGKARGNEVSKAVCVRKD